MVCLQQQIGVIICMDALGPTNVALMELVKIVQIMVDICIVMVVVDVLDKEEMLVGMLETLEKVVILFVVVMEGVILLVVGVMIILVLFAGTGIQVQIVMEIFFMTLILVGSKMVLLLGMVAQSGLLTMEVVPVLIMEQHVFVFVIIRLYKITTIANDIDIIPLVNSRVLGM